MRRYRILPTFERPPKSGEAHVSMWLYLNMVKKLMASSLKSSASFLLMSICLLASQFAGHRHGIIHLSERPVVFAGADCRDFEVPPGSHVDAYIHYDHCFEDRHSASQSAKASHEPESGECHVLDHLLLSAAMLDPARQIEADVLRQPHSIEVQQGHDATRRYARLARGPPDFSST